MEEKSDLFFNMMTLILSCSMLILLNATAKTPINSINMSGYTCRGNKQIYYFVSFHSQQGQLLKKRICSSRSKFFL